MVCGFADDCDDDDDADDDYLFYSFIFQHMQLDNNRVTKNQMSVNIKLLSLF